MQFHVFLSSVRCSRWWIWAFFCLSFCSYGVYGEMKSMTQSYSAIVNLTYKDPASGQVRSEERDMGMYGLSSRHDKEHGVVVHVRSMDNGTHGCTPPVNVPVRERWIALVERGQCKFHKKIFNTAVLRNASAVVIYDYEQAKLLSMQHQDGSDAVTLFAEYNKYKTTEVTKRVDDVVSIFMKKTDGDRIARLVDNGTKVMMRISVGKPIDNQFTGINKTSILFVSISFIVLMIISLAWLVFYYIQRFRYAHAKERLSKRLMNAAKKAISKMPVRTVRSGDSDCNNEYEQCAVCIEMYRAGDVLRILPCKHFFHKTCIDPWLIEHRSCPMCKLDVLKAYGLQVHESYESVIHDIEGATSPGAALPGEEVPLATMEEAIDDAEPSSSRIYTGPPELELHQTPDHIQTTYNKAIEGGPSMDSVHTVDSDCAERQALMGAQNTADSTDDAAST